ncbi:hypothetical protein LGH82_14030 [Mesorhizobium sp. PAMC28654]|uniref:hypothetical protein n=1 Tax=Mesorhizobium sp. PAMC28654 TaxID=2880934 RepID=UPI001D0A46F8|nr:hypothetical protein [Mesorhizobium sp. PAMC28654]UDL92241.1 hypothetical protein LGH82_14030 [Mesorhizobium sp. PAMC28654]
MEAHTPRPISRSAVEALLLHLPLLGADYSSADFDADLFSLIDPRKMRKAMRTVSDVMERDRRSRQDPVLATFDEITYEVWVSETPDMEVDCEDENGKLEFVVGPYGYTARDGSFVESPRLDPIPEYTRNTDDAIEFKASVFQSFLRLSVTEVDGQWGSDYRAALLSPSGDVVHDHLTGALPHAIIGAVLGALLSGWTRPLASYELIDE